MNTVDVKLSQMVDDITNEMTFPKYCDTLTLPSLMIPARIGGAKVSDVKVQLRIINNPHLNVNGYKIYTSLQYKNTPIRVIAQMRLCVKYVRNNCFRNEYFEGHIFNMDIFCIYGKQFRLLTSNTMQYDQNQLDLIYVNPTIKINYYN